MGPGKSLPFTGAFFEPSQIDLPPKAVFQAAPVFPSEWRKAGTSGQALVDFIVDAEGAVRNATVVSATAPALGEAALEAVNTWQFAPGQKNGANVSTHLQEPFGFRPATAAENAKHQAQPSLQWF